MNESRSGCRESDDGWLTEPELDAAYQLIQLSGDSAAGTASDTSSHNSSISLRYIPIQFPSHFRCEAELQSKANNGLDHHGSMHKDESQSGVNCGNEISFSPSSSSSSSTSSSNSAIGMAENLYVPEELTNAYSLRKRKFRSIVDLYAKTKPVVKIKKAAIPRFLHE